MKDMELSCENINNELTRLSMKLRYLRDALMCTFANVMVYTTFGITQYDYMSTLKKHAKKLDCPIEDLRAQVDGSVYDVEL